MSDSAFVLRITDGPARGAQAVLGHSLIVGRETADLIVTDPYVSRHHAELRMVGGQVDVGDVGSHRGTLLDGRPLHGVAPLQAGHSLAFGESRALLLRIDPRRVPPAGTDPPAVLVERPGGGSQRYLLGTGLRVGRDPARAELVIEDPTVSGRHCVLWIGEGAVYVEDLGSHRGTAVNGSGIAGAHLLADGDLIQLGRCQVRLRVMLDSAALPPGGDVDPVPLAVRIEGEERLWNIEVDSPPTASTGEVLDAIAAYLGFVEPPWSNPEEGGGAGVWAAYLPTSGLLLDRKNPWWASAVGRGDEVIVAPVRPDSPAGAPADPPHAPVLPPPRRVEVVQLPRVFTPIGPERIRLPQVPEGTSFKGRGLPWRIIGGIAGVSGGLTVALLAGSANPTFLIGGLVFAFVGLLSLVTGVFGEQSRRRHAVARFREELAALDNELGSRGQRRRAMIHRQAPPIAELVGWVRAGDARTWERRDTDPDFLRLRVGTARRSTGFEIDTSSLPYANPLTSEVLAVVDRHTTMAALPVQTLGPLGPIVGIVGVQQDVAPMLRSLVLQAAILHSPRDLRIAVLSTDQRLDWVRWLPHVASGGAPTLSWDETSASTLAETLRSELEPGDGRGPARPRWLVLTTSAALRSGAVRDLLDQNTGDRAVIVVTGADERELPPGSDMVLRCMAGVGEVRGRGGDDILGPLTLELLDPASSQATERILRRVVDPRAVTQRASSSQGLLEMLGVAGASGTDLARHWWDPDRELLTTPVGMTDAGEVVRVGIRRDGPHGLVAGTTGSGKSEFLQTLLAGLATTHAPDELNMFLVDFKGGATFTDLRTLPHVVGLVTDLEGDSSLAERAFTAMDAEIIRRKRLLDAAGVADLVSYERLSADQRAAFPSLLVVIDEFALLVREQPQVTEKLDTVAAQGRSLGVHLLLSMQSPGGVISRAVRVNTNTWVCLRVVDPAESKEVIGRPDAASISHESPGRALIRVGAADRVTAFQSARITRPIGGVVAAAVTIRPYGDSRPALARQRRPVEHNPGQSRSDRDTELSVLCRELIAAARARQVPPQRQLWHAPLPARLVAADLPDHPMDAGRLQARLGLADLPQRQTQATEVLDLSTDGNALVVGEFGAGKTTTLIQLALDLAEHHPPSQLHLYALDSGAGGLKAIESLPHTGAVVGADDSERFTRLVELLSRTVDRRRSALAVAGSGWLSWRSENSVPWIVVLFDDWPVVKEAAAGLARGSLLDQITSLAQAGPAVGIHLVLATPQRSDLRLQVLNHFGCRVVLRQTDPADYDLAGLRLAEARTLELGAGRALVGGRPPLHVQIVDPEPARFAAIAADNAGGPAPLCVLARSIPLAGLRSQARASSAEQLVIGVGGQEYGPIVLDERRSGPHLLVAGDDLSGRSTALRCYLEAASEADPAARFVVLTPRPSPLRALAEDPRLIDLVADPATLADRLAALLSDPGPVTHLVIDDADQLPAGVDGPLEQLLRTGRERGLHVAAAGRESDLVRNFSDRWVRYLMSLKSGIVLMPRSGTTMIFELRAPDTAVPMVPGRGYLVDRTGTTLIQLADPDAA